MALVERTTRQEKDVAKENSLTVQRLLFDKFFNDKLYEQSREEQIESLVGIYAIRNKRYRVTRDFIENSLIIDKKRFQQLGWKLQKEIKGYISQRYEERTNEDEEETIIKEMGQSIGVQDRRGSYLLSQDLVEDLVEELLPGKEISKSKEYRGEEKLRTKRYAHSNSYINPEVRDDHEINEKQKTTLEQKLTDLTLEQKIKVKKRFSEIYALEAPYKPSEEYFVRRAAGEKYNVAGIEGQEYIVEDRKIAEMAKDYYRNRNPISFFGKIKRVFARK